MLPNKKVQGSFWRTCTHSLACLHLDPADLPLFVVGLSLAFVRALVLLTAHLGWVNWAA